MPFTIDTDAAAGTLQLNRIFHAPDCTAGCTHKALTRKGDG